MFHDKTEKLEISVEGDLSLSSFPPVQPEGQTCYWWEHLVLHGAGGPRGYGVLWGPSWGHFQDWGRGWEAGGPGGGLQPRQPSYCTYLHAAVGRPPQACYLTFELLRAPEGG